MDEEQPNVENYRGQAGPVGILGLDEGAIENYRTVAGDAYKVVHAQESVWMLHLRLVGDDGEDIAVLRVVLGPERPSGGGERSAAAGLLYWISG